MWAEQKKLTYRCELSITREDTLQEINISHLGKRKIIFKYAIFGGYVSFLEGKSPTVNDFSQSGPWFSDSGQTVSAACVASPVAIVETRRFESAPEEDLLQNCSSEQRCSKTKVKKIRPVIPAGKTFFSAWNSHSELSLTVYFSGKFSWQTCQVEASSWWMLSSEMGWTWEWRSSSGSCTYAEEGKEEKDDTLQIEHWLYFYQPNIIICVYIYLYDIWYMKYEIYMIYDIWYTIYDIWYVRIIYIYRERIIHIIFIHVAIASFQYPFLAKNCRLQWSGRHIKKAWLKWESGSSQSHWQWNVKNSKRDLKLP